MARKFAKQVGALWRHEKEGFGAFLTGTLDLGGLGEVPIAVFQNQRKKNPSEPDFRGVLSNRPPRSGAEKGEKPGAESPSGSPPQRKARA